MTPADRPADRPGPDSPPAFPGNDWAAHPMLVFGWARRMPRSLARDLLLTFLFNLAIAGAITLLAMLFNPPELWARAAWVNVVIANCIGFFIHAEFALAERLIGVRSERWSFVQRALFFTVVPMIGVFAGYAIAFQLLDWDSARRNVFSPTGMIAVGGLSIVISSIIALVLSQREKTAKAQAAYEAERARVATAERSAALAQLQALEARVEPHFLYNTLAHVVTLVDREPATAKRMVERLIVLLRSTAGARPDGVSTLGEQVAHARAYLELLALRMGPRLAWSVDVPPALEARTVPPALLQPLVENAIKHGIEPKVEGGRVAIAARDDGGRLVVDVSDSGAGFGAAAAPLGGSTGVGLANLRARLAALYGSGASLAIAEQAAGGVRATVTLPAESARG